MGKTGTLKVFKTKKERDEFAAEIEKKGRKVWKANWSRKVKGFTVIY